MRISLAQLDSTLGDVDANLRRIATTVQAAQADCSDLVVFPELATHGFPIGHLDPESHLNAADTRLAALAPGSTDVVLGFHEKSGIRKYNSAGYLSGGSMLHVQRKLYLPTYLSWEERKFSSPGQDLRAFDTSGGRFAITICNDAWQPVVPWLAAQAGAEVIIIPANSAVTGVDIDLDTIEYWSMILTFIARMNQSWVVFVNRVGTENGARYWGASRVVDPSGAIAVQGPLWQESLVSVDIDVSAANRERRSIPLLSEARLGFLQKTIKELIRDGGDL